MRRHSVITLAFGLLVTTAASAQITAAGPEPFGYRLLNVDWFAASRFDILRMGFIQEELKLGDAQKALQESIFQQHGDRMETARESRPTFQAALRSSQNEAEAALLANLEPMQRDRLDQIQLQVQGPTAFALPDLPQRLEMSDDQIKRIRSIVDEVRKEMMKTALIPLPSKPVDRASLEALHKLVESQEFATVKQRAWQDVFGKRDASLRRIEQLLTERQLMDYQKMLGRPFDVQKLWKAISPMERGEDNSVQRLARELGLGGQRADPDFDVRVSQPAYVDKHPSVLFDEAHHNFHTTDGRYKAFGDLIVNDGYRITPNKESFTADLLAKYDILVTANAMGAERMGRPSAAKSAFTSNECKAVRDWVDGGGSLLLITDHAPFGSAAQDLAREFKVEMSTGVTIDRANDAERGLLFSRENHLLGDHAITSGRGDSERVSRVLTFTGQSLKGPAGCDAFLMFSNTARDRINGQETSAAGRAQGLAIVQGKGRVVVLGEASQLSAQLLGFPPLPMGMNAPGCDNRQMALNIMHWLSGLTD